MEEDLNITCDEDSNTICDEDSNTTCYEDLNTTSSSSSVYSNGFCWILSMLRGCYVQVDS